MRIGGVPVKRIAREPLVENAALVHVHLRGGTIRVGAGVVEGSEFRRGVCVELELHVRTHRTNEYLWIVQRDLSFDPVADAPVTFNGLEVIGELRQPALPPSNLVRVDDQRVAVPEAD